MFVLVSAKLRVFVFKCMAGVLQEAGQSERRGLLRFPLLRAAPRAIERNCGWAPLLTTIQAAETLSEFGEHRHALQLFTLILQSSVAEVCS